MFSVALLLLLAAGSCVKCEQLTQPASVTVQPGQRLTITCQVSYSVGSYYTYWIRQPAGKGLEWIGYSIVGGSTAYKDSLKSKFNISLDSSSNTATLNGQNVQPEDTAVYYCARESSFSYAFDYWGQGTKVTVSSQAAAAPDLFPLVQCNSGTTGTVTVGCIAQNFFPETLTFQWTDASGTTQTFKQYPMIMKGDRYTGVSVLDVSKSVWDSRRSFSCSVTHPEGSRSVTLQKSIPPPPPKATLVTVPAGDTQTSLAPITVTLTQSSPKEIFSNNQAKFECVITGPDQSIINDFQIIWQVDGQNVTDRIETKPGIKKISTMTRAHTDWQSINKVSCSAIRDNMTPVTQELTIQKGDGSDPKVTVHIPTWEDSDKSAQGSEVTLVCLVSSRAQQDYYIAWREDTEQNAGTYSDGINFPRQKTQNGYSVTSIYITTKDKWEKNKFICNVWPAGRNKSMRSRDVSYALSNSVEYCNSALSCTDGVVAEDEYSSLWSTTSSFIFLFICSLLYSTIISLVKIK